MASPISFQPKPVSNAKISSQRNLAKRHTSAEFQPSGKTSELKEMTDIERIPCKKCGAKVLPRTIQATGGFCTPCYKKDIKQSKRESQESIPSYFGGSGAGKGWHQNSFILSKEELHSLLCRYQIKLYVTNRRVPDSYDGTSVQEFVYTYGTYLGFILSGQEFVRRDHFHLSGAMYISVFLPGQELQFEFIEHKGQRFKRTLLSQPPIHLSPSMVYWSGKSLSLRTMNEKGYFGLTIQYPKVYYSSNDGFSKQIPTHGSNYHKLYESIWRDIKSCCKTRRFLINDRRSRPKILISESLMPYINRHWYLQTNSISVL